MLRADREAPQELDGVSKRRPRVRNYLGNPASLHSRAAQDDHDSVESIRIKTISEWELEELGAPTNEWFGAMPMVPGQAYDPRRHVAWALSLFRLRVRMLQDVSALVVLGGKDDGLS